MSEPLWIATTCLDSTRNKQKWEAAVMDGERRVGPVVKSHSRKSARAKAYGALAKSEQPEEQP